MESSVKQVVVEEPLDPDKGCCKPGCCCWPCALCCSKCCLPRCCKCPSCCGCHGCGGCGSCVKRSLCFVPRLLCYLPRKLLGCTHHLKCLLITVVVVVLLVVIIAGALLMWLRADQRHADAVLWMGMMRGPAWEENAATFYLDSGDGNPATVIYDYKNLLVSYRSQLHRACYITRMDKDNIPGLDTIAETFQRRQVEEKLALPLADRSLLVLRSSLSASFALEMILGALSSF
ncbi:pulmonary surfactant-associated protein C-like [Patagioenas fasciata monilis]|uniref:Surfactant protein C n=1 Tax=Patagioenas fasciata monilis TaxID=372326 RepID=A0A1V4KHQ4_PATFA|nr:pulmonary surfactant-associated protein C-like [Patagioenas fasciata monilis]